MNAHLIEWRSIECGCYECPIDWMWRSIECGCYECPIDWMEIYCMWMLWMPSWLNVEIYWMWMLWMPNWLNRDLCVVGKDCISQHFGGVHWVWMLWMEICCQKRLLSSITWGYPWGVHVMNAQLIEWRFVVENDYIFSTLGGVSIGCGCYECGLDWIEEENSISHTKGYPTGKLRDKFPHHKSQS